MKKIGMFVCVLGLLITMSSQVLAVDSITDSTGTPSSDFTATADNMIGEDSNYSPIKKTEYNELDIANGDVIEGNHNVAVYVSKGSTYTVKIPKQVILDGKTCKGEYVVAAKGEVAEDKKIQVMPYVDKDTPASETNKLVLTEVKYGVKSDIYATIEQDKQEISPETVEVDKYAEATKITGIITAEDLTVGTWNGTFILRISLEDK